MTNSVHENDEDENQPNVSEALTIVPGAEDESQVSVRHPPLDHPHVEIETSELDSEENAAFDEPSDASNVREVTNRPPEDSAAEDSAQDSSSEKNKADDDGEKKSQSDDEEDVLPRMLGDRYRLESLIAKGGMGKVYRGRQLPLERSVAVKVLGSSSGLDAAYRRRFLLEASVCASLTHPNIVVVYDYGETSDGVLFMAMELLPGRRLSQVVIEDGPMSVARGAFVALQVARALREAHRQGVAHRDLKPGNVFLTTASDDGADHVKVFDFGLAKVFEGAPERRDMDLTMDGVMMGSPRYMSPEQIRGEEVDARADVYAFGAMLYMLLCGRPPFLGENSIDVLAAHIQLEPPTFAEALAERGHSAAPIPPALQALALRCLEKEASKRYQSMDQPILELKRILANLDGAFEDRTSSGFAPDMDSSATRPAMPLGVMNPPKVDRTSTVPVVLGAPPMAPSGDESPNRNSRIAIAIAIAVVIGAILAVLLPQETADPTQTVQASQVALTFSSEPAGAAVYLDDVRQGVTPFESTYELGTSPTFRFRLAGFEDELVRSEVTEGAAVDVRLRSMAPAARILPSSGTGDPPPTEVSMRLPPMTPMVAPTPTTTPMRHNPTSVSMRPTTETPTTPMAETAPERPRVVPLVGMRRGLVDDSTRVPVVD